ncbi:GIY-YIG nuclease family protein [Pseudomonas aeruginosa]|uniref:GIY-YIG nuclease family protein n=1 Tax=Pseudomonas aeruginosa TaxID=287 RepID=UPI00402BC587
MSGYGFVYVLTSPAMPGLYKVGATTRSPRQRAEELSRGTGVPHEFEVAFYAEVQELRISVNVTERFANT